MKRSLSLCLVLLPVVVCLFVITGCRSSSPAGGDPNALAATDPNSACPCSITADTTAAEPIQFSGEPRGFEPRIVYYQNTDVPHNPVYLTGKFDDATDDYPVTYQAWGKSDRRAVVRAPIEMLVDTALLPVDMFFNLPWEERTSRSIYPIPQPASEIVITTATAECYDKKAAEKK